MQPHSHPDERSVRRRQGQVMGHYRRLSPQDASFLYGETRSMHMHVGTLAILEDPGLSQVELNEHIDRRLNQVPRFRQKLQWVPLGQGRPVWVDDELFDVRFHVRHTGLPRPGGMAELYTLMGRLMSIQLDRDRPLWELWLVDLPRKRKAMILKTHHALIDGVSGMDLSGVIFDAAPDVPPDPDEQWTPRPAPRGRDLVRESFLEGFQEQGGQLVRTVRAAARAPDEFLQQVKDLGRAVKGFGRASLEAAPHTSLSSTIGPHRRFATAVLKLSDVKRVKNRLGGTVNDVVLAVVTGALRHLLKKRGDDVTDLVMRAAVPVSMRGAGDGASLGNRVAVMLVHLPVGEPRVKRRYEKVLEETAEAKSSNQAGGVDALMHLGDIAPPTLLSLGAQAIFQFQWVMNLIVTNVPGPQTPFYFRGGKLLEFYPLAPLLAETPVSIAILSYDGRLFVGLNGDWDAMHDLETLGEGMERSLQDLLGTVRTRPARKATSRARRG